MALPVFDPEKAAREAYYYNNARYYDTANINNDTVNVEWDEAGKFLNAWGSPFSQDGKQYVRDYDAQGNVVNVREYNKPSFWSDIGQPALFLGSAALGANLLGPLVNSLGATSAAGSGAWLGEGVASGIPAWDAAYGGALLEGGAGLGAAGVSGAAAGAGGVGSAGGSSMLSGMLSNPTTLANLAKLALTAGAANAMTGGSGGTGGVGSVPTQGIPMNTSEYFNQVQSFLNQYIPGQMPNQTEYLKDWYSQPTPVNQQPMATTGGGMSPDSSVLQALGLLPKQQQPTKPATPVAYPTQQIADTSFTIPAPSSPAYDPVAAANTTNLINTLQAEQAAGRGAEKFIIQGVNDANSKTEAAAMYANTVGIPLEQAIQHMWGMSSADLQREYAPMYTKAGTPIS